MTPLLSWLAAPSGRHGIRFALPGDGWDFWPYARLAGLVRRYAATYARAGVEPGDVVSIVESTGPRFVGAFFGALYAGATPSPLAPPAAFGDPDRYADHLTHAVATARPTLVVNPHTKLVDEQAKRPRDPGGTALLQFTSGTTGRVRGVRVPYGALEANIAAIQGWLRMTPDDPTASWLPVHHDMGLTGCLLAPVVTQSDLWLMSPGDFIRRPARYLECFGVRGARLTAMPAFGLDHIVRRVRPEQLAGSDVDAWRAVIVGAERIPAATLEAFTTLCGLPGDVIRTAYGLAEATLAVTGLPLGTQWTVTPEGVVGCGPPLSGVTVDVVDGEIVVGGASLADAYADGTPIRPTLRTGDAGFLRDGQLYVLGRFGDSLKVRGRSVFAEDLDAALVTALDAPAGRLSTVLGYDRDRATAVVVFERATPRWLEAAPAVLRPYVEGARVVACSVRHIPRTTSGKPRRRHLWLEHLAGRLG